MLRKTAKKIAITLNLFLLMQLASLGLGVQNAFAEEQLLPVLTIAGPTSPLVQSDANTPAEYSVTLDNRVGQDRLNVEARVEIYEADKSEIKSFEVYDTSSSSWINVGITQENDDVVGYWGPNNGPIDTSYFETFDYRISFENALPATRQFKVVYTVRDVVANLYIANTSTTFTSDAVAPTVTELPAVNQIFGTYLPLMSVTGTDDTRIGNLVFSMTGPGINVVDQAVAPETSPAKTSIWDLAEIFTDLTGETDLSNVQLGDYSATYYVKDGAGNVSTTYSTIFRLGLAAPTINPVTSPTNVNEQILSGTKPADTHLWLDGTTPIEVVADDLTTWSYKVALVEGVNTFSFYAKDASDNVSPLVSTSITLKTVAPPAVTGVTATPVSNGVQLTWVNPTDTSSYEGLKIVRTNGSNVVVFMLPDKTASSYLDTSAVKGVSYTYAVIAYDAAGNSTFSVPYIITYPADEEVVAPASNEIASAAISDSAASTEDNSLGDKLKDIKGSDINPDEDEKTEDNGLPFWGLMLLLILAGVGAYLFWIQKPAAATATPAKPATKSATTKKTPPKKK